MKSFIEKIKTEPWHLHFLVMLPIAYLFSSFFKFTLDGDLRGLEIVLLVTLFSALVGLIWEFIHYYENDAVFSVSDVIATALGGLVGSLIFIIFTPNFNIGALFFWLALAVYLYKLYELYDDYQILWPHEKKDKLSDYVGYVLLYTLAMMFVAFVQIF